MSRRACFVVSVLLAGCTQDLTLPEPPPEAGPGSLSGRVVRAIPGRSATEPVEGAVVRVLRSNVVTRTNAEGRFVLTPVPSAEGTVLVQAAPREDGSFALQRFLDLALLGAAPGRDVATGDVLIGENALITGRVRLADRAEESRGHRGITVFVPEGPFTTYTGDDGSFRLENVPAGRLTLAFFKDGYQPASRAAFEVRAGESVTVRELVLERQAQAPAERTVGGTISANPSVADLSGATIGIRNALVDTQVGASAQGGWEASLSPGLYSFTFALEGYASVHQHNVFVPSADDVPVFEIPAVVLTPSQEDVPLPPPPEPPEEGPGMLLGRVVRPLPDGTGIEPVEGARLRILNSNVAALSSADGRFALTPIPEEGGVLFVQHDPREDGTWGAQRLVSLEALGAAPGVVTDAGDLLVRANAGVSGRVLLRDRLGASGGHRGIGVLVPGTNISAMTSDDGGFLLPNVPEGRVSFVFFHDGYRTASATNVEVRSGESLRLQEVVLELATSNEPRAIEGSVAFDPPVADPTLASVTAVAETPVPFEVLADGGFTGELTPGRWTLRYEYPGYGTLVLHNVLVAASASGTPMRLPLVTLSPEQAPIEDDPPEDPPVLPPVAEASAPAFAEVGSTITLDAGGSIAPANHPLRFSWVQVEGELVTYVGEDARTAVRPRVTLPPSTQTVAFEVTVTDERTGLLAIARVETEVVEAPVAMVTAPSRARVGGAVLLDASPSAGPAGHPLHYVWTQLEGSPVELSRNGSPEAVQTTFTAPAVPQRLSFRIEVTDTLSGLASTADVSLELDVAPTAVASGPNLVATNSSVIMDASGSVAPAGHPLVFTWVQASGDSVSLSRNASVEAVSTTFVAPARAQSLAFDLSVLDETSGLSGTTRVVLQVAEPPRAEIAPAPVIATGGTGRLDASPTQAPAGAVLSYRWAQTLGDPVALSIEEGVLAATPTFVAPETPQALGFALTVTDLQTGLSDETSRVVVVRDRPNAVLSPATLETRPDTPFALDAGQSSDPFGAQLTYRWTSPDGAIAIPEGSETASRLVLTSPSNEGNYEVRLVVSNGVLDSLPSVAVVSVTNAATLEPVASAGPDMAASPGARVVLQAEGSHPDPTVELSWQWTQIDGEPQVALHDANTPEAWFDAPGLSSFLRFRVTLSAGTQTVFDDMEVQVQDTTPPSVVETEPAAGLLGSPLFASVTFDEPMLESSFDATTVKLESASGDAIETTLTWSEARRQLRIVPLEPLTAGETVTLTLEGVQDRAAIPNTMPTYTASWQVRPLLWRLWSSSVESGAPPQPDIAVTNGSAVISAVRNSGACTGDGTGGSWILRPHVSGALVEDPSCFAGTTQSLMNGSFSVGGAHYVAVPAAGAPPVILREGPTGWGAVPGNAPGGVIFELAGELVAAWNKVSPTTSSFLGPTLSAVNPGTGQWSEIGTVPTGYDPSVNSIYLDGANDRDNKGIAVARLRWAGPYSPWKMDALFYEWRNGAWQQLGPAAFYRANAAGWDTRGVRGAYWKGSPVVYFRQLGGSYAPPIVNVGVWNRDTSAWVTTTTSITSRGPADDMDARENYFVYVTAGRVYLMRLNWDGTSVTFTEVPGPTGGSLNSDLACTASHPRLALDGGVVWVTFDETCAAGEWHVRVRRVD